MLKLSLKPGEYITLGDNIKIIFSEGSANNIHLLVDALREINVARNSAGKDKKPSPYHHIPSERIPRNTHMEVKFYKYGSTTQHAGSQCQQNVRSYNKRTVQKRWLTTARTTFLHRLDSLCLHRQISLIRVYFLCYSNFCKIYNC